MANHHFGLGILANEISLLLYSMKYNPDKHHRRSIRLKGYDYSSSGAYFITICTSERECLFGEVVDGAMQLNQLGQIVAESWLWLETQHSYLDLDVWIVMPNHLHGILVLKQQALSVEQRKPLGRLIGAFKTVSTKQINLIRKAAGVPVWQRNYYEHIHSQ